MPGNWEEGRGWFPPVQMEQSLAGGKFMLRLKGEAAKFKAAHVLPSPDLPYYWQKGTKAMLKCTGWHTWPGHQGASIFLAFDISANGGWVLG